MKKLTLTAVFPDEDGMFFHNKVFRIAHSFMRNLNVAMQFGINEDHTELYWYAKEDTLVEFLNEEDIRAMMLRNIYTSTLSDVTDYEPILKRVNHYNPAKKARNKMAYLQKKYGYDLDPELLPAQSYVELKAYYLDKLKIAQRDPMAIYFIANKNGHKISIYAHRAFGDPRKCKPNSYGLDRRKNTYDMAQEVTA